MDFSTWKWLNESTVTEKDGALDIYAPAKTDWFNNPIPHNGKKADPVANAPFYYTEVEGDFSFSVKVTPHHAANYDACAIMAIEDENLWTKVAFEKSDFGTCAAVCVVTNVVSDDANGCDIDQESVWLKLCRVGDIFSAHYSLDGETYHMVRLFHLPAKRTIKVGVEAQSPSGDGGNRSYSELKLEHITVQNLRAGI